MMLSRLNAAVYKYYFMTWIFILVLFKRNLPKWMHKRAQEVLDLPQFMPKVEKYVK